MQMETKSQEEIENINRQIISTETESVLKKKKNPNKIQDHWVSMLNYIKHLEKSLTYILPKTFPKTAEEGMLLNSLYEASITLIPKPKIGHTQKKLQVQKFSTKY